MDYLRKTGIRISNDNKKAVNESDIIIVALKPYNILEVLKELNDSLSCDKHIIVSLATGISIEQIQNSLKIQIPIFTLL